MIQQWEGRRTRKGPRLRLVTVVTPQHPDPAPPAHCLGTGHTQEEGLRFLKAQCDSESLPEGNADKEGQDPELAEST